MKFGGLHNSEITGNSSHGHIFAIGSVHTDFIQFQGNSSNVLIEGNMFLPANRAAVQGIFMGDGTYNNMTVENNLIYTGMLRGISISPGSGNVVRNNTLIDVPNMIHNGTAILVPGGTVVENNIVAAARRRDLRVEREAAEQASPARTSTSTTISSMAPPASASRSTI